jgi:hypothetical protein
MKKLFAHLSMLCLLALLLVPIAACERETEVEEMETPATEEMIEEPIMTEPMTTEPMDTAPMGTEPMDDGMAEPPAAE